MAKLRLPDKIKNWSDLVKVQEEFRDTKQDWVFRGHEYCEGLKTTLEKVAEEFDVTGGKIRDLEVKLILEFMRPYHLYGTEASPKQGDTLDWLSLMRHYGAPTRFLDFTFSILVAAYFALEKKRTSPTIWAVNKSWLTDQVEKIVKRNKLWSKFKKYATYRDSKAFRDIFMIDRFRFISAVGPFRMNQRLTIQQGIFLCPGDVRKSFLDNLQAMHEWNDNAKEIRIDPSARQDLLEFLFRANVNNATLFPGLDGFAKSLWTKVTILKNFQKMEKSKKRSLVSIGRKTLERL